MKFKNLKLFSLLALGSIVLSGCYADLGFIKFGTKPEENENGGNNNNNNNNNSQAYDTQKDSAVISEYYSGINQSSSGTALLSALRSLNLGKRTSEVGYTNMGTNASQKFKYTDYDPATVRYTESGVPYGSKISSFYSGKTTSVFNREHVWPKSRGGDLVENDILMVRPTVEEENSDRGNSVYVTGMATEYNGWDPVTAFGNTIGVAENIRGECARIIFYCMTASSSLVLGDGTGNSGNNMGKISDLVEWACDNPVTMREKRRNVGAQFLQGNRNAFVDHPEYVCKIWGDTNSKTKAACSRANYAVA